MWTIEDDMAATIAAQHKTIERQRAQLAHAAVTIESQAISSDLIAVLREHHDQRTRIAELESQLAAALATIEAAAQGR